ncbi:hypothetical protein GCM10023149_24210 [Mucilaginibacter gynuensis]|uniref:DUF4919 domain-containing protein n=1 Tax=Mucilaginibacter gynuensis TaxID=1302236 RepID=A0ABP8GFA1_9SPHI
MKKSILLLLSALMLQQAHAQDMLSTYIENNTSFTNAYMYGHINKLVAKNYYLKEKDDVPGNYHLTYRPNTKVKQQVVESLTTRMKIPEARQAFMQYDFDATFNTITKGYDLKNNDAGDIMTAYQVLSWIAANQYVGLPDKAAVAVVRKKTAAALAALPAVNHDVVARAKMSEEMKILIVILQSRRIESQKKHQEQNFATQVNAEYLNRYGQDLQKLKLDSRGIHP